MHISIIAPLAALASFLLYKLINSFVQSAYHSRRAKELGCEPPPTLGDDGPFGLYAAKRFVDADKAKRFPDMLVERFDKASRQEGRSVTTFGYKLMGADNIFTCDPRVVQALLATQFKDFCLGRSRFQNFYPLLGHGIFSEDGERWEQSRALLRPQFVRAQVGDLELDEKHFQNLLKAIKFNPDGWTDPIDILPLFFRFTMDNATEFLFGESVNSQLAALPGYRQQQQQKAPSTTSMSEDQFAGAFDLAQSYMATGGRLGDYPTLAHNKEFRTAVKTCHDFIDHFVRLALERRRANNTDIEKEAPQKKKYVFLEALAQETSDPLQLRDELLSILLAARDTTASLLGWIFQLLAQHPPAFEKLRSAIVQDFGTYAHPQNLSFAGLKACAELQNVVSEALRLYAPVSTNSRRATRDTTIPVGGGRDGTAPVYVRAGQEVNYSVHVMHRRRDLWGDDADEFRPDRWVGRKASHPFEFLPFNAGPRICLGQQLAIIEASYVVVRLIQVVGGLDGFAPGCNVPRKGEKVRHGLTLINCPADGVKLRLKRAEGVA